MTFEADLVALLTTDYDVRDAINDVAANELRIYPVQRPPKQKNLDAIVYQVIVGAPASDLDNGDVADGVGDLEEIRFQVDIYGETHDSARELARLVQARMKTGNASIRPVRNSRRSEVDPDTREHREVLDYSVWHTPQ